MAFNTANHFKRGQRSFTTRFITGFCTSTFDGLFNTLGGPRTPRLPARRCHRQRLPGHCWRRLPYSKCAVPANHGSQRNRRRIYTAFRQRWGRQRRFAGAGTYTTVILSSFT